MFHFNLRENNTSVRTEFLAALTTFLTVAYILVVHPAIMSDTGMPRGGVFLASVFAGCFGTLMMAKLANYPFVLLPGMGVNAYFAYTVCLGEGWSYQLALCAVLLEGLVFIAISATRIREAIFNSFPDSLRRAIAAGIGLFIVAIALQSGKIAVDNPATLFSITSFKPFSTAGISALLTLAGTLLTGIILVRKIPGGILLGLVLTWLLGMLCELTGIYVPDGTTFVSVIPSFHGVYSQAFADFRSIIGACFDVSHFTITQDGAEVQSGLRILASLSFWVVAFIMFFNDLFDTLGTLIGVSQSAGFVRKDGTLPRIQGALMADALATTAGAVCGTSTVTTLVESASGVGAGGRTGLTGVFCCLFFLLSIPLLPFVMAIPAFATAPALIIVGVMMVAAVSEIDFRDYTIGIPAFLCIAAMGLLYSIAQGIIFGVVSYTLINLCAPKAVRKPVSPVTIVISVLLVLSYILK